jgi:Na+-transporting NADH:ubiquinone oxidoreductase subunit D
MPSSTGQAKQAFSKQLWDENPVLRQVLGICSSLAVTNLMFNTLLMCLGLLWATALTSATVSALRTYTPQRVRMIVQVLLAAVYVIVVDIVFRAQFPDVHKVIGPYVGLIITNCIIMGRAEAFAVKNPVLPSLLDGLGAGLGYSAVLMLVALIREVLGFGTVFGVPVPWREAWWHPWTIMVMPPGAFFVLALVVWVARGHALRREAARAAKQEAKP